MLTTTLWRLLYIFPNLAAALGMMVVALMAWSYRAQRGARALCIFAVASTVWALFETISFIGLPPEWILFVWHLKSIGVSIAPLAMMVAAFDYFGYGHLVSQRRIALLSLVPIAKLFASWTNGWHGLVWRELHMDYATPFPTLTGVPGLMTWVYYFYAGLLLIITTTFLLMRLSELPRPQQRQVYIVIAAMLLPLFATTAFMLGIAPLPNTSFTPLAFNVSGFFLLRGFSRGRMFELPPVTAYEIYRSQDDAVFVIDKANRVLDLNIAARNLLVWAERDNIGGTLPQMLPQVAELLEGCADECRGEVLLNSRYYDVRISPLHTLDKRVHGRLLVWRDVTDRKWLETELRRLAVTDELTGLYNRRHFFARGEEDVEHAMRYGRPLSLIMVDVDHFKEVNDRYGHEAGDRALVLLAGILSNKLRNVDCVGRIGGEEFALLMPETTAEAACEVATRLINEVAEAEMELPDGQRIGLTISVGVVTLQEEETSMNMFLRRADIALYKAKKKGRNRIVQM
ncbi:MAG: diguanylate cyclase [Oxalobacter sp.]|nr:MAG: diguanylate cyclase [Oxalobacter sp.]